MQGRRGKQANAQGTTAEETSELDVLTARERRHQLRDQVTAQDEEKIDADPTETMGLAWKGNP